MKTIWMVMLSAVLMLAGSQANAQQADQEARRASEQARRSAAGSLAFLSLMEKEASPTTAFRLAEYALACDSLNPRAYSALLQAFYAKPYFFGDQWHGSPLFLQESREDARPAYPDAEYTLFQRNYREGYEQEEKKVEKVRAKIAQLREGESSILLLETCRPPPLLGNITFFLYLGREMISVTWKVVIPNITIKTL